MLSFGALWLCDYDTMILWVCDYDTYYDTYYDTETA